MPRARDGRAFWWGVLVVIILTGVASRLVHTGFRVLDKYLGDALYAAMVYAILRLTRSVRPVALWAAVSMVGIEVFQLTGIAAQMLRSSSTAVRICGRLLGTEFSVLDMLAYTVGIAGMAAVDLAPFSRRRSSAG